MWLYILLFIVGLVLLIKGGDWFVDGATGIAKKFHLPELLIGATIVSIGTTLPEVMVSATSAFTGHGEIAYGNAIGSIICNTSLIAALTIAIRPSKVDRKALIIPVIFFTIALVFYTTIAYTTGYFYRIVGIILLLIFVTYITIQVITALKHQKEEAKKEVEEEPMTKKQLIKNIILLIVGAALIAIGADLLVDNGCLIAEELGVPESVIALTFVALGTSLPELVTAITSLVKGHSALSLGNIIGANLFNLILVSGVATTLSPFEVPASKFINGINASLILDIPVVFLVMGLLLIPTFFTKKVSRIQGIILLLIYATFTILQFVI